MAFLLGVITVAALPASGQTPRAAPRVGAVGRDLVPGTGAATLAASLAGSRIQRPRRVYSVAALGDSLTDERVGGGRYLRVLRERCPDSRFDAYGVGGQRTDHFRWRLDQQILDTGRYQQLIVLGGVNDLAAAGVRSARIDRTTANLAALYARATGRGMEVVAVTLPPWTGSRSGPDSRREATLGLNAWIRDRALDGQVARAVDVFDVLRCGGELCREYRRFPDDLVHWNERGHRVVGEKLYDEAFSDCR